MHAVSDGQDHAEQKQGFMQFGNDYGSIWENNFKRKRFESIGENLHDLMAVSRGLVFDGS